ncbi:S-layer homology domain-containing protein [Egbenema bharatensis]|uniref:S-layer homology domain-containing protein n=1 Tax=Egbenema bharatensis TaxID=3463334 RepID=UPI003A85D64C
MSRLSRWLVAHRVVLSLGLTTGLLGALTFPGSRSVTAAPDEIAQSEVAQNEAAQNEAAQNQTASFPDTEGHWAQPFIQPLAEQGIVTGYLDGTFRPENPVNRDEFAAVVRQAFSQETVREIASGEVYQDVPADYWAAPAIEEAYEMGFMQGYPGGFFRPNQPVSRAEAIVALADNLDLEPATELVAAAEPERRQVAHPFPFPLAMTYLLEPLVNVPRAIATQIGDDPDPGVTAAGADPDRPVSVIVDEYYADADQIPQYAVDRIANATKAGMVVNHPDPQILNPNGETTRGSVAAFVHQAMVNQGRVEPLSEDMAATNYIVQPRELEQAQANQADQAE